MILPLRTAPRVPAFSLLELISAIAGATLLVALCFQLFNSTVYLQRLAAQHADRTAAVDHLARQLRADLLAAERVSFENPWLRLSGLSSSVDYRFVADHVARFEDGREIERWHAVRLSFSVQFRTGPAGDLLRIDCIESPPPRATRLGVRCDTLAFPLWKGAAP